MLLGNFRCVVRIFLRSLSIQTERLQQFAYNIFLELYGVADILHVIHLWNIYHAIYFVGVCPALNLSKCSIPFFCIYHSSQIMWHTRNGINFLKRVIGRFKPVIAFNCPHKQKCNTMMRQPGGPSHASSLLGINLHAVPPFCPVLCLP